MFDGLERYQTPTQLEDIDVVFYNRGAPQDDDAAFIRQLESVHPNVVWSVVNEAHAHNRSGDAPYDSLVDAVRHFPETASAVAVQLSHDGTLRVMAPYGLADLLAGIIRKAPEASETRFVKRRDEKRWFARWRSLRSADAADVTRPRPDSS